MDTVLSEFVRQTGIDPGLGQDLLDAQNWDLQSALKAFRQLSNEDGDARQGSPVMNGEHGGDASSPEVDVIEAPNCVAAAITVADDDEFFANKKLARGISRAVDNVRLVSRARTVVAREIEESAIDSLGKDSPVYTFIIPDITGFADEFRAFLEKDLIETSTLVSLEQGGRLNWWADAGVSQRLYPLVTTGDGNCLLHAASLGMWGFHDRLLTLRKALYATLTNPRFTDAFYRRWRYQQSVQNLQAGLVYCESEWEREWESILKLASTEPRSGTLRKMSASSKTGGAALSPTLESSVTYESLEEFHVFVLAHVLHRSIIVVADTMLKDATGEAFAPINFGGVYLPLERLSSECHKWPLVLTYDAAHFSALVTMDTANRDPKLPVVVPLTDKSSDLLTMHFAVDVGAEFCWSDLQTEGKLPRSDLTKKQKLDLVHRYLDVVKLPVPGSVGEPPPPCASNGVVDGDVIGGGGSGERKSSLGSLESDEARSTVSTASSGSAGVVAAAATADGRRPANGSVARQFSTFGRSLSKKLKHNFSFSKKHKPGRMADGARADGRDDRAATATRTKKATAAACAGLAPPAITVVQREDRSGQPTQYMLSARICTDRRFEYQEEMLRNYLNSARRRYEDERRAIELQLQRRGGGSSAGGKPVPCVNAGCALYGTITTNYLCSKCFARQKEHAATLDRARQKASTLPKFLAGKSKFYTEVSFLEREPYSGGGVARGGGAPAAVVEKDGQGGDADVRLPTLQEAALTTLHCELSGDKSKRLVAGGAGAKASSLPRSVAPPLLYSLPPPGGVVDVEQIVVTVKTAEQATKMGCAIATAGAPPARKSGSLIAAAGALPVIKVGSVIAAAAAPPAMMVGASTPTKTGSVIVTAGAPPATKAISVTATAGAPPAMKAELRYRQQKQACKTRGCHAFGEEEMEFLCSACYQEKERSQSLTPYIISHRI